MFNFDKNTFSHMPFVAYGNLACDINIGRDWSVWAYDFPKGDYLIDAVLFKEVLGLDGNAPYSIRSFVNGTTIKNFCYKDYEDTPEYNFPSGFTGASDCLFESGVTWQGVENCLKIYPTTNVSWQSPKITDIFNGKFVSGVVKKIKMKLYYPTTNKNSTCIKLISSKDSTIYPADEWQTVEFYKSGSYTNNAYQWVCFRNDTNTNFAGNGTGDEDVVYIASVSAEFDGHALVDIRNLKETDYAIVNRAYTSENNTFAMLYPIGNVDYFLPRIVGDRPITISVKTNESLQNLITGYQLLSIKRIEVCSTNNVASGVSLGIGEITFPIAKLTTGWQFFELAEMIYLVGQQNFSCSSTGSATLTLRLYVWR